jgi:ADP-heptose:LPS heptosyltransferase
MPLSELYPVLGMNASFVSLQYTDSAAEIAYAERKCGKRIHQFDFITDKKSDYDLTAEVVNSCDLVIAVNTSVVHLAGALGKECWTLTPSTPAWRYGPSAASRCRGTGRCASSGRRMASRGAR